jgi:hypothetical protein
MWSIYLKIRQYNSKCGRYILKIANIFASIAKNSPCGLRGGLFFSKYIHQEESSFYFFFLAACVYPFFIFFSDFSLFFTLSFSLFVFSTSFYIAFAVVFIEAFARPAIPSNPF